MNDPEFPSEEQGGFDPMPTQPQPLSPPSLASELQQVRVVRACIGFAMFIAMRN
ncbi:hypothetical protein D3C87_1268790 [compost metagenome]